MDDEEILEIASSLLGISYPQWFKVRMVVDAVFDKKKSDYARQIALDSEEELKAAIKSRF